jgi:Coenzyme F420-reducing hydrogenase, gamma subunit
MLSGGKDSSSGVHRPRPPSNPLIPADNLPVLNSNAPAAAFVFVQVDLFIPGCPPAADTLFAALSAVAAGKVNDLRLATRFGA